MNREPAGYWLERLGSVVKKCLVHGAVFVLGLALGLYAVWGTTRWPDMTLEMAREMAEDKLQSNSLSRFCFEPQYAEEVRNYYDRQFHTWDITYAVTKPGFEGSTVMVGVFGDGATHISLHGPAPAVRSELVRGTWVCVRHDRSPSTMDPRP